MAENTSSFFSRRHRIDNATVIVVVLLAVAALWRLLFFFEMYASPYAYDLGLDGAVFNNIALEAAAGRWTDGVTFYQAPLYPRALGLFYLFFGPNPIAAKLLQIVLSVVSCWLVYRISERVFDETVARLALAMSSVYGMYLFFANELVVATFFVFVTLIALDLLLKAWESDRALHWWASGLAFGVAAITRGTVLPFAAAVPLWLIINRRRDSPLQPVLLKAASFAIGVVLMVLPVSIHNYWADQNLVVVASSDGVNFYIGNSPDADGMTAAIVGIRGDHVGGREDQVRIARKALGNPTASPGEVSKYWYGEAIRFIRSSPGDWFALMVRKVRILINAYEVGNNRVIPFMARHSRVFEKATIGFWLVLPLAGAGMVLGTGRRPQVCLLSAYVLIYSALVVAFFVTARFRLPIIPVLIVFAASAIAEWCRWIWGRGWAKGLQENFKIFISLAVALLLVLLARPVESIRNSDAQAFFNEAEAYRTQGNFEAAALWYASALEEYPEYCDAGFNLGRIRGEIFFDPQGSVDVLAPLAGPCREDVALRRQLGLALCAAGRCAEALPHLRFVVEREPGSEAARSELERAARAAGAQ